MLNFPEPWMTKINILWFKSVMNLDSAVYDYFVWKGGVDCLYIQAQSLSTFANQQQHSLVVCVCL